MKAAEDEMNRLASQNEETIIANAKASNRAFLFIKPHAVTDEVEKLVGEKLKEKGMKIIKEGVLTAKEIDEGKLIDKHYYAIASKAVLLSPAQLNVPEKGKKSFKDAFGLTWEEALEKGFVKNAKEAAEILKVDGDELEKLWRKVPKNDLIKFGGGFYCAKMDNNFFVLNGFYMQMRGKYTTPGNKIKYYEVEWNPKNLNWKDFREEVLGSTDPSKAKDGSLRRLIYNEWQKLGLKALPDTGGKCLLL